MPHHIGTDQKLLQTFAPAGYRVFPNYSPRQIIHTQIA